MPLESAGTLAERPAGAPELCAFHVNLPPDRKARTVRLGGPLAAMEAKIHPQFDARRIRLAAKSA
jgi:hypothetical protein